MQACRWVSWIALRSINIHFYTCADIHTHTQMRTHKHTWFDLAGSDRGLIGVSVSGWADLKCPCGLVPGRETDRGLESPTHTPLLLHPLLLWLPVSRPSPTPQLTHTHTHLLNPDSSSSTQHLWLSHTGPSCLGLWVAWISHPPARLVPNELLHIPAAPGLIIGGNL